MLRRPCLCPKWLTQWSLTVGWTSDRNHDIYECLFYIYIYIRMKNMKNSENIKILEIRAESEFSTLMSVRCYFRRFAKLYFCIFPQNMYSFKRAYIRLRRSAWERTSSVELCGALLGHTMFSLAYMFGIRLVLDWILNVHWSKTGTVNS